MLEQVDQGLWCAGYDLMLPGKIHFNCRMTIIQMPHGQLLLHSPVPIDDGLAKEIETLGQVAWVVAPNNYHHLNLRACAQRWPDAALWGPPGLSEKRKRLDFSGTLGQGMPEAWESTLAVQWVEGAPKMNEFAFFHKPTKTLIVTDLMFHIHHYQTRQTGLLLRVVGAHKKLAQSRFWRFFTKERKIAGKSAAALFRWDFQRIIMAHGEILEVDARGKARDALRWMLKDQEIPPAGS